MGLHNLKISCTKVPCYKSLFIIYDTKIHATNLFDNASSYCCEKGSPATIIRFAIRGMHKINTLCSFIIKLIKEGPCSNITEIIDMVNLSRRKQPQRSMPSMGLQ